MASEAAAARCCFARAASSAMRASAARRFEVPSPEGADGGREEGATRAVAGRAEAGRRANADELYIELPRTAEPAGAPLDMLVSVQRVQRVQRAVRPDIYIYSCPMRREGANHGTNGVSKVTDDA
eukprot:scaffold121634_cov45-Phaeocystis_antarctica.AAC.1